MVRVEWITLFVASGETWTALLLTLLVHVVTSLGQALQVGRIPEQARVSFVWLLVINNVGADVLSFVVRTLTVRILLQLLPA